ncbi:MAG: NUDIX domain-containing protein [Solobacterium sp.]|nr:NUDIX domain-containing protein [Solobacterium sp.]
MRMLFVLDAQDYDECIRDKVRDSARAIIIRDGKAAMVHSTLYDYYKFPGGGIRSGEDPVQAMIRETREEAGLAVIPASVREFGCVHRVEKNHPDETERFIQDNFYYLCKAEDEPVPRHLDAYEQEEGFTPEFVDPETAIAVNLAAEVSPRNRQMLMREARVLRILIDEGYFS